MATRGGRSKGAARRAAIVLLAVAAAPVLAAEPEGWRPARPDDFLDTPHAARRAALPGHGLSASGDFDGNGRRDAARLMVDAARGEYVVAVDLRARTGEVRVKLASAPLHQLGAAGLAVERGRPDRLVVFTFDGARQRVWFEGGRVRTRWD